MVKAPKVKELRCYSVTVLAQRSGQDTDRPAPPVKHLVRVLSGDSHPTTWDHIESVAIQRTIQKYGPLKKLRVKQIRLVDEDDGEPVVFYLPPERSE
jgi:hypothetical protein